jgi:membrane protein DedA with SNARE-associated domain
VHELAKWLVEFVNEFGYIGIFVMAFLESTFVPIPSEVTMVPAGYLVQQGRMAFVPVFIISTLGAVGGALLNYFIAYHYGRRFLFAFGKYMFFDHAKMAKLDAYFATHGEISTFTGRLIPGIRHVISFPAGLAHMDLKKFCIYTGVGGAIWMLTLITVGYIIGDNPDLVHAYMPYITGAIVGTVLCMVIMYVRRHRLKKKKLGVEMLKMEKTNGMA